jgi:hypothetical protein
MSLNVKFIDLAKSYHTKTQPDLLCRIMLDVTAAKIHTPQIYLSRLDSTKVKKIFEISTISN